MSPLLLGIDLGTSGVKALLLDAGKPAGPAVSATVEYGLSTPYAGWNEQDPEDWWRGVGQVVRTVLERSGHSPGEVAAVALSGQMHGATVLDEAGTVLRPVILWNDQRTAAQCAAITERVGLDTLVRWVANPALAGFTAPKLLWIRDHEPEVFARIRTVLLPKDYINYRLAGVRATEVSDASGTLLFDVARRRWSEDMARALEIPQSILPPVHESDAVVGHLTAEAARHTGLVAGTPVVAGGADNACAALGAGVIEPGQVLTSIGTSGTVVAPSREPRTDPRARLHLFCHAVPGVWYAMGVVLSAGGSLRWFRDTLADELVQRAAAEGRDAYDLLMEEAATVPAGSEGLVFLPYLSGERTPHGNPAARGVFFGLSLRHTRAHLTRSVVEGVTYALADSIAIMRDLGIEVGSVRATGGGARSALWRRLQADIFRARVLTAASDLGPALGAALLAGVGVGAFASAPAAVEAAVRPGPEVEPDEAAAVFYGRQHAFFNTLYPALANRFDALGHEL